MSNRHGLGRGLGALLSSSSESTTTAPPIELPITAISPNPNQPRKDFDDNALRDLSDSLRHSGLLQPLVVRRMGDGYQLIVGERRWRAAKLAGIERVPVIVREASDSESLELALVENLLREDLNPMEEAEAYQRPPCRVRMDAGGAGSARRPRPEHDRQLPSAGQAARPGPGGSARRPAHHGTCPGASLPAGRSRTTPTSRGDPGALVVGAHDRGGRAAQPDEVAAPAGAAGARDQCGRRLASLGTLPRGCA